MNKERREKLHIVKIEINNAINLLDNIKNDEEIAFDNLTEGLQQTIRGEQMEENIKIMDDVVDKLNEAIETLRDII